MVENAYLLQNKSRKIFTFLDLTTVYIYA